MWKHTYYVKILLALFLYLAPVSLVSCSLPQSQKETTRESELSNQQVDSLSEITRVSSDLENSINDFVTDIKSIKDTNNKLPLDNIKKLNEQLKKIRITVKEYKKQKSNDLSINASNTISKIDEIIGSLLTVTDPLNNGLNQEAVKKVKEKLNNSSPKGAKQNFNQFDAITTNKISNYLLDKEKSLNDNINKLVNSDINFNLQKINKKNDQYYSEFNNLKWFSYIALALALAFSLIILVLYLQLLRKSSSSRGENRIKSENENYSVSTGKNQQHNVASNKEFSNPAAESNRYQQLYTEVHNCASALIELDKRLKTLEQNPRGNNISNYQQPTSFRQPYIAETSHPDISRTSEPSNQSLQSVPVSQPYSSAKLKLATTYNDNPDSLLSRVIDVNITKESLDKQRLGSNQYTILEHNSGGSYWILKEDNFHYLLPRKNFRINQHNISTVEALFECQNYQASSKQFNLIKPAKVTSVYGDKWQLEEMGILKFY